MAFRVVCISRTMAAGGEMIGRAVSERLGYRYVDEDLVTKAAEKADVDPAVVEAVEHRQPLINRLLDVLVPAPGVPDPSGLATGLALEVYCHSGVEPVAATPAHHRELIRAAIHEIAKGGQAVIVAHAASMALGGMPGVLRVLVTASAETRALRLAAAHGITDSAAAATINDSDCERRDYFRSFCKIKEEVPTHYDIVINTDLLSSEQAVNLILCAAQS